MKTEQEWGQVSIIIETEAEFDLLIDALTIIKKMPDEEIGLNTRPKDFIVEELLPKLINF